MHSGTGKERCALLSVLLAACQKRPGVESHCDKSNCDKSYPRHLPLPSPLIE